MPTLTRLRPDHAPAVLAFERENRAYFARSVPDRGDDYFASFADRLDALLAEQRTGAVHLHVLVGGDGEDLEGAGPPRVDGRLWDGPGASPVAPGTIVGRINLVDVADGSADLGYRIAERAAGRGLASAAVRELCSKAVTEYGLSSLTAATTADNAGSAAVLTRAGFTPVGPVELDGRPGTRYRLALGARL